MDALRMGIYGSTERLIEFGSPDPGEYLSVSTRIAAASLGVAASDPAALARRAIAVTPTVVARAGGWMAHCPQQL
jgi:hypothetical protein